MKTKNTLHLSLASTIALLILNSVTLVAQISNTNKSPTHTIQINTLEMIGEIYSAVYLYEFSPKNHIMLGVGYQNWRKDFCIVHAPSLIIGYRRFFWKGLNADFAFWPAYNWFYEKNENKHYNGAELWGEFRVGYELNFKINNANLFITPQFVMGKGIIRGNKPQSLIDYYKNEEPIFMAPNIALGFKF